MYPDFNNNNNIYLEQLGVLADLMQVSSFFMNIEQVSNDEIMKRLQKQDTVLDNQDKILDEQTNSYLEVILKQNNEILKTLKLIEEKLK